MSMITLLIGIVILVLLVIIGIFASIQFKRHKNAKLCEGGYHCEIIGPDRVWMKVLPAENGLIVQPKKDDKRFYVKGEPEIPWPTDGYIVPKEGPVPNMSWPQEASPSTQVSVGHLIFHVGSSLPLGYDKDGKFVGYGTPIGTAPEIIAALYKSKDTVDLFRQAATEADSGTQAKGKVDVLHIITIVGVGALIILAILIYMKEGSGSELHAIFKGFGF